MRRGMAVGLALVLVGMSSLSSGADDSKSSREREMLRRAQEALRQSQTENGTLAASKLESEQKLKAAAAELDAARKSVKSAQSASGAKLKAAIEAQAETARQLENSKKQIAALTAKQQEMANALSGRESDIKRLQVDLETSRAAGTACEAKNLKLYEYSQDLAHRYQKKGVWAALSQKEPVLGLGGVKEENLLQEYQQKFDSQRLQPGATNSAPSSAPAPVKR